MEMLGFILVAFLGFIGQVAAFGGVLGVDIQLDVNTPFAANTANGSYAFPSAFGASDGGHGNSVSSFASVSIPESEVPLSAIPTTLLDELESLRKSTPTSIETSWTKVITVATTTTTVAVKPTTGTVTVTQVSTLEGTTTRAVTFVSSTATLTYGVIVGYSTESVYTTTWFDPPNASTYTEVLSSTITTESLVVPTDVTYTFSSFPASFSAHSSDRRKSNNKEAAVGAGETVTFPGSASIYSEVVTIPGNFPGQSITFTYTSEVMPIPSSTSTSTYSEVVTIPGILPGESITFTFTSQIDISPDTTTMPTFSVNTSEISPSGLVTSSLPEILSNSTTSASTTLFPVVFNNTVTGFPSPNYPVPVTVDFTAHSNNTSTITKWTNCSAGCPATSRVTHTVFPNQTPKTTATAASVESSAGSTTTTSTSGSPGSRLSVSQLDFLPTLANIMKLVLCMMFSFMWFLLVGPHVGLRDVGLL